ncbi:hypothetical protein POX_d05923 [Penicillium oxalicum]|uniref:hypothetical protein n=1 Tax=Penicillium oxalicum TaxID=69781 RepID=UPI0020B7DB2A|nr:hypothetical protein POX_d05923 [Penicillium oxalicum]KAI2790411.1 hypothetical protein POX_d05923 [Penicillium oxalicum]
MTSFAEKAHEAAIQLSLHKECTEIRGVAIREARSRAWWATYLCVCHASMVSCKPPIRAINTRTLEVQFPTSEYISRVWERYIRAEETLVAATLLLVSLVKGIRSKESVPNFRRSFGAVDKMIQAQLAQLTHVEPLTSTGDHSPEYKLAKSLHTITRMRLMSANMKIHRYRALMEYPAISRKFASFPPLDISERPPSESTDFQSAVLAKVEQIFPFPNHYSLQSCINSALAVSECLGSLRNDLTGGSRSRFYAIESSS